MSLTVKDIVTKFFDNEDLTCVESITLDDALDSVSFLRIVDNPYTICEFISDLYHTFDTDLKKYILSKLVGLPEYIPMILEHITDVDDDILLSFKDTYLKAYYSKMTDRQKNILWGSYFINDANAFHHVHLEKTGFRPDKETLNNAYKEFIKYHTSMSPGLSKQEKVDIVLFIHRKVTPVPGDIDVVFDCKYLELTELLLENGSNPKELLKYMTDNEDISESTNISTLYKKYSKKQITDPEKD